MGPISWNSTWRALRMYRVNGKTRSLVEERKSPDPPRRALEGYYASQVVRMRITAFGRLFYEQNWVRYHDRYPDVDAPASDETLLETEAAAFY